MGIFDKIKGMVGSEDLDYNEYDGDLFGDEMPGADPMTDTQGAQPAYDAGYSPFDAQPQPQPQPQRQQAPMGGSNLELKVVKPDRYEMVNQIADHLLNRRTVVLNLEDAVGHKVTGNYTGAIKVEMGEVASVQASAGSRANRIAARRALRHFSSVAQVRPSEMKTKSIKALRAK